VLRARTLGIFGVAAMLLATTPWVRAQTSQRLPSSTAASLPSVASGARPGPDVLYAPPPDAPQLENRSPRFRARPILVMGQEAYVDGEYLYQDWIYDDNGGDTGASDAGGTDTGGDYSYPTDRARFAGNAADLVELRISPNGSSVAYRFTLNALLVPNSSIVALAFDTDGNPGTGRATIPRDPGFSFPGTDEVITTWGTGAEHSRLSATGNPITTPVEVSTDLEANQITVVVPRSVSDPSGTWKATLAVGLHNPTNGSWLRPGTGATATAPAGAGPLDPQPSGIFDLGLTFDEAPAGTTAHDAKQSVAIRQKAPGAYQRDIDFGALARRETKTTVPATGTMSRLFASRINFGEGKNYDATPELLGQLQPYSIYVPKSYDGSKPVGLTLDLHSLGEHHWQYNNSKGVQQIGEGRGNIVITCECRGEDGWYQNEAEYDVFEMWNDVASHYRLDPDRTAINGYSMGGYATYRLATLYPDLFGKAFTIVGPPADGIWVPPASPTGGTNTLTNVWLENARNVPFLNVVALLDELVPIQGTRAQNIGAPEASVRGFEQLGYRYRFVVYPTAEHLTLAVLSYDMPYGAEFLGDSFVDRNPFHVTFSYAPAADDPKLGLVHDHAYWVSEVRLADDKAGTPLPKATVDVLSHTFGKGDPPSTSGQTAGTVPLPYVETNRSWGQAPVIPVENKLTVKLTNVRSAVLDSARAGLDLTREITVATTASSAGELVLEGAFASTTKVTADGAPVDARVEGRRLVIPVAAGAKTFSITGAASGGASRELPATGRGPAAGEAGLALLAIGLVAAALCRRVVATVTR
jgi:poly(3-hydroxybutyrate) depolymerase